MIIFIRIDILLRFLINNINNNIIDIYLNPCIEMIDNEIIDNEIVDNKIYMYSPLNDENVNNKDTIMTEPSNDNEKVEVDNKEINSNEHKNDNKINLTEKVKSENTISNEIKEDKGKGKRNYESDSDSDNDDKYVTDNSKKPRENQYRDKSENYESSDYSGSYYSEDEESNNSKNYDNKNEELTLIVRRPEIIDNEIKNLSEDLNLIEKAKRLDNKLPSDVQWLNDSVSKLSLKGYHDFFDKKNGNVKESLERVERYTKKELDMTEAERNRCKDTINASGSEVKSWDNDTLWLKISKKRYEAIMNQEENTDSEPDVQGNPYLSDSEDENKSENEPTYIEKDTSIYSPNSSSVSPSHSSGVSPYYSSSVSSPHSPNVSSPYSSGSSTHIKETSPELPSDTNNTSKPEVVNDIVSDSSNNKKMEDKKLTPGDYIDNLPQDMPGFMDDID